MERDPNISTNSHRKISSYLRPDPATKLFSREYILLQDSDSLAFSRPHSGRHFLFDAGSTSFDTSLAWMLCGYRQRGISFDKAMAWEMKEVKPTKYWSDVPLNLISLLHFSTTLQSAQTTRRLTRCCVRSMRWQRRTTSSRSN